MEQVWFLRPRSSLYLKCDIEYKTRPQTGNCDEVRRGASMRGGASLAVSVDVACMAAELRLASELTA